MRNKYWQAIFDEKRFNFDQKFTSNMRHEYYNRLSELVNYDFTLYNIFEVRNSLQQVLNSKTEETIIKLFDEFSHQYHWTDTSKNIHYYNGWATNKAWIINKRIILPMSTYCNIMNRFQYDHLDDKFRDMERTFDYLDKGRTTKVINIRETLERHRKEGEHKNIELKYFNVTFYKKGTCHIEFTDLELLKKLNIFGAQGKGWLPPTYGKRRYKEMAPEEKAVVDSFEGESEYNKVMDKQDFYFIEDNILKLAAGQ